MPVAAVTRVGPCTMNNYKLRLLRTIIPYILNVSHYMTDLVYLLYYLENVDDDVYIVELFKLRRVDTSRVILSLRNEFRELLNTQNYTRDSVVKGSGQEGATGGGGDDDDEIVSINKFRNLLDKDIIQRVCDINALIVERIEQRDVAGNNKLINQLNNCLLGFINLNNFIGRIPLHGGKEEVTKDNGKGQGVSREEDGDETTPLADIREKYYHTIIDSVLDKELILYWKIEIDLLNCQIFDVLTNNDKILRLYNREVVAKEQERITDISHGESFIKFISWLKNEQVFKDSAL